MRAEQTSTGKVINFTEAREGIRIRRLFRGANDSALQEPAEITDFQEALNRRELLSLGDSVMRKITQDLATGGFVVERNNPKFEEDVKVVLRKGEKRYIATQCTAYPDDSPEDEPTITLSIEGPNLRFLVFDTTTEDLPYTLLATQESLPLDHVSSVGFMREILGAAVDVKSTRKSFIEMAAAFENKQDSPFRVYWFNPVRIA